MGRCVNFQSSHFLLNYPFATMVLYIIIFHGIGATVEKNEKDNVCKTKWQPSITLRQFKS